MWLFLWPLLCSFVPAPGQVLGPGHQWMCFNTSRPQKGPVWVSHRWQKLAFCQECPLPWGSTQTSPTTPPLGGSWGTRKSQTSIAIILFACLKLTLHGNPNFRAARALGAWSLRGDKGTGIGVRLKLSWEPGTDPHQGGDLGWWPKLSGFCCSEWELVRHAESQTYWIRTWILARSKGSS